MLNELWLNKKAVWHNLDVKQALSNDIICSQDYASSQTFDIKLQYFSCEYISASPQKALRFSTQP